MSVKTLDFLSALKARLPETLIEAENHGKPFIIFRLGLTDADFDKLAVLLKEQFGLHNEEVAYIINLEGVDLISPSAAKATVKGAITIMQQRRIPIIFTQAAPEALLGLQIARKEIESDKVLWAIDLQAQPNVVGDIPDRFSEILEMLAKRGQASASDLAENMDKEATKKQVNKFSVYLQEVYNAGLLIREKVVGSERSEGERGERGWTYNYSPAYRVLAS